MTKNVCFEYKGIASLRWAHVCIIINRLIKYHRSQVKAKSKIPVSLCIHSIILDFGQKSDPHIGLQRGDLRSPKILAAVDAYQ